MRLADIPITIGYYKFFNNKRMKHYGRILKPSFQDLFPKVKIGKKGRNERSYSVIPGGHEIRAG